MKNTGSFVSLKTQYGRYTVFIGRRSTQRNRTFSAARLSDILPGSYLFRAISRFIAVHTAVWVFPAPHACSLIIKDICPNVNPFFGVFYEKTKEFLVGKGIVFQRKTAGVIYRQLVQQRQFLGGSGLCRLTDTGMVRAARSPAGGAKKGEANASPPIHIYNV